MQIDRLFETIYLLLERKTETAGELAERFGVSVRTIYRDIETLSSVGIPVYMSRGKGGGISLLPGFVLNKAVLTENEKADILSSLKAVGAVNPDETEDTLKKLSGLFGRANTEWIEVDFTSWYGRKGESETFQTLKSAILNRRVVSFSYSNGRGETMDRRVEPFKLCFRGQAWYLYGFCRKRGDFRFFKLSRIKGLSASEEGFSRPCPPAEAEKKNPFSGEMVHLKLCLSHQIAFRVFDEFDEYERLPDGSFVAEIDMPRGEWLYQYIASFGEFCEVTEPQEVRTEVLKRLQKSLSHYL